LAIDLTFEQVVRDHQAMVFRTLLRLTGTREHLDDLAQEVFLRLHRALPGFRGESLVATYLYRIAVNVAQDEWKRRRREDRPLVPLSHTSHDTHSDASFAWEDRLQHPGRNAEQQLEDVEFQQQVETHLLRLSAIERSILVLYHQEERTYEQIALALGLPIGTVRTHLHRGRKKLREAIEAQRANPRIEHVQALQGRGAR
jgi:RNA polymerase sigma-70 factor (ECF subfamily)